jgi:hypothetical protein
MTPQQLNPDEHLFEYVLFKINTIAFLSRRICRECQLKYASSELRDPVQAVAEFASMIGHEDIETILFFFSGL